jgi:ubiquinone/menaquinone biosynthesis C-methylase UbiE
MRKPIKVRKSQEFYTDPDTVLSYDAQRFVSKRDQMRYRLQWTLLTEMLPAPPAMLLEIGCGTGIFAEEMNRRRYRVIALDPSLSMLSKCRERLAGSRHLVHLIQGSGTMVPIERGCADACFCVNVLSHIPEPIQIVREMIRITRSGGSIVFNFTNLSSPVGKLIHYLINPLRRLKNSQKVYTSYHSASRLLNQCKELPVTIERVTGLFPLDWRIYPKNLSSSWIDRIETLEHSMSHLDRVSLFQQAWFHLRKLHT